MRTRMARWIGRLAVVYGAALTGFLALRGRLPEARLPLVAALNSGLHLLLKPALVLLPLALLRRRVVLAGLLVTPVVEYLRAYAGPLMRRTDPEPGEPGIRLLTYNLHAEETRLDPQIDVIRSANADVVALQELSFAAAKRFAAALADRYPHQALHPNAEPFAGQGILSRFPVTADDYWQHVDIPNALGHQRAVLDVNGQAVVLYNLHPVHPGMVDKIYDAAPRADEVTRLLARIEAETLPVVLAGDFNMSDQSDDYRRITARLQDAFRQAGRGLGYTFPDWSAPQARSVVNGLPLGFLPPLVRLDYVFHNPTMRVIEARAWPDAGGSDHRPLLVRLKIEE
ncbi:MAG: endonuclease/exonuclease/phosphatase family protein [Anaerolineae bacterium]|nr:endonuclease/exonuclease/phosphatase family protein [Anaerolineae bacterium]